MPVEVNLVARARGDLPLYEIDALQRWGLDAVVTGRRGGVSAAPYDSLNLGDHVGDEPAHVAENRRRVATALGHDPTALVIARQVHGARVNDVDQWSGEPLEGDAMVTTRHDIVLGVLVADCVPLVLVDTASQRYAVVHAGWRGLLEGVIAATLSRFANPAQVRVAIGPHISPLAYQVGPEVARHFAAIDAAVLEDVEDRSRLDLSAVALHQLALGGVEAAHVIVCSPPTDGAVEFFSDRAQRPGGRFGLFAHRSYDSSLREGLT